MLYMHDKSCILQQWKNVIFLRISGLKSQNAIELCSRLENTSKQVDPNAALLRQDGLGTYRVVCVGLQQLCYRDRQTKGLGNRRLTVVNVTSRRHCPKQRLMVHLQWTWSTCVMSKLNIKTYLLHLKNNPTTISCHFALRIVDPKKRTREYHHVFEKNKQLLQKTVEGALLHEYD